jgi:DNA-binding beta-propeller fold protein YncE
MRSATDLVRGVIIVASAAAVTSGCQRTQAQTTSALNQIATIPLTGVNGRIDHLTFDPARNRLFVAALGNNTVEVVDTATAARVQSLSGFHEPQGLALVADLGAVAVANGDTGTLQLLDASTLATRWTTQIGGDADNVR